MHGMTDAYPYQRYINSGNDYLHQRLGASQYNRYLFIKRAALGCLKV
jgi:hypothetical protein